MADRNLIPAVYRVIRGVANRTCYGNKNVSQVFGFARHSKLTFEVHLDPLPLAVLLLRSTEIERLPSKWRLTFPSLEGVALGI
jgi:hypothetical protein